MKLIKGLITTVVVIVAIVGVAVIGGYVYVRKTYGIDLFNTVGQLKTLSKPVNESELCPSAFGAEDFVDVKDVVNTSVEDMVKYEEGKGYEGYSVDMGGSTPMKAAVSLTEKQVGALGQTVFYQKTGGKIDVGGKSLDVKLIQTDFLNIDETGSADVNVVVKLDLTPFKAEMNQFPFSYLKKYVPDSLYVSSTVRVQKGSAQFDYTVTHKTLTLNGLSAEDTEDLFKTLDMVFGIGSAEKLNLLIGTTVTDALIGNEKSEGFAYSLKSTGAKDFAFVAATATAADAFSVLY